MIDKDYVLSIIKTKKPNFKTIYLSETYEDYYMKLSVFEVLDNSILTEEEFKACKKVFE